MKERLVKLWRVGVLAFLTMALLGCASQAESMPDLGQPLSPTVDASCADLEGTDQVEVDLFFDEYGVNLAGCVDGSRAIESATLIYLASCMGNPDIAMCRAPFVVDTTHSFGGSIPGVTPDTPLSAIEVSELVGNASEVVVCELSVANYDEATHSANLLYQCGPTPPLGDST